LQPTALDSSIVVVASNGGATDRDPAWCLNLRHDPHATVEVGSHKLGVSARGRPSTNTRGCGRWKMKAVNPFCGNYEQITDLRRIPVVVLQPTALTVGRARAWPPARLLVDEGAPRVARQDVFSTLLRSFAAARRAPPAHRYLVGELRRRGGERLGVRVAPARHGTAFTSWPSPRATPNTCVDHVGVLDHGSRSRGTRSRCRHGDHVALARRE
jgi:deazaflavin-dependent oxidoreductase (nitroreductase family)